MSVFDEMRNDIEVLYGGGACGYNVYSDMVDYIDEADTDYESLRKENDRLRKERDHWHVEQVHAYGNWEDAHKRASELEADNDKLRKLADAVKEFVEDTHCEDCPFRRDCDDNNRIFCADDFSYHAFAAMRELGVEVPDV